MKITFRNKNNEKIVGTLNIVNKKSPNISIIIHGFSSNKDRGSKKISQVLSKNKINNLAIDLDNRGESEPIFEDMTITKYVETILCAVNYCQNKKFTKINIIGTSSGALSAMTFAIKYQKSNLINSLILRSVSPSDAEWFKEYVGGSKGIAKWKKTGYILYSSKSGTKKIKYNYYKDALKYNMYLEAKQIKVPTLIIHGTKDEIVPISTIYKLKKNFPKAKLITIKDANHSLGINKDFSKSQKAIVNWLKQHK